MLDDFKVPKSPQPKYEPPAGPVPPFTDPLNPNEPPFTPLTSQDDQKTMMPKKQRRKWSKKKKFVVFILPFLIAGAAFAGYWSGFRDSGQPQTNSQTSQNSTNGIPVEDEEESDLLPSALSGVEVASADANRPVTAIMIENSSEARPQSGLKEAGVVFEAIAEGGITRFLALFQSTQPDYIGPVRSARPYYVEWAAAFDAGYVHAGGSPDGLQRIRDLGVKDISAFAHGEDVFFRTSDRFSPHNLYTTFKGLDRVNQESGFTKSTFTPWVRKQDVPQAALAKTIDINISAPFYNPHYDYDAATNTYLRSEGGEIHKDEKSGKQLAPNAVLAMAMNRSQSGIYSFYTTTGSGTFRVFQDGVVSEGTWTRAGQKDQYSFKDKYGFDFRFNKGQVWVSVVESLADVTSAP